MKFLLAAYIQESGRAGRDGDQAEATIFCNASDLASNVTHLSDEMRDFCRTKDCRRQVLMRHFGFNALVIEPKHMCCDNCLDICCCEECEFLKEPETEPDDICFNFVIPETENEDAKVAIKATLEQYFKAENSAVEEPLPHLVTGLCTSLIDDIANRYTEMRHVEVLKQFANIKEIYANNIATIINHIRCDYHK